MDPAKTHTTPANASVNDGSPPLTESVLRRCLEALRGIHYGTVTVIIQDGRVIQIDRTERKRFTTKTS